jgi:KipI family sensor histidine kinase inhibitor
MKLELVNENSIIVYFANTVSISTADIVTCAYHQLRSQLADTLLDIIPSYTSILLSFDPRKTNLKPFIAQVKSVLHHLAESKTEPLKHKQIVLPVYYGQEVALDHTDISRHTDLAFSEVVALHTAACYRVFAIGFAPGFAYLGNTPSQLSVPRKATPRLKVPKGSVAIADQQTAVYPDQSPGGWQVIGRTPLNLLDISQANLSTFEMGDEVRFESIDKQTFLAMGGQL